MKAFGYHRYGGPDVLELADVPQPQPREREVLVRVHATSVNAADRVLLRGKPFLFRLAMGFPRPRRPTLGFDVAGRVEAVGRSVTRVRAGDDVFGASTFGAFAEFVCVNQETLVPKPAGISFEEAAATPTAGYTALLGLREGRIEAGQTVLIDGYVVGLRVTEAVRLEEDCRPAASDARPARRLGPLFLLTADKSVWSPDVIR